jgi:hypothetical protein
VCCALSCLVCSCSVGGYLMPFCHFAFYTVVCLALSSHPVPRLVAFPLGRLRCVFLVLFYSVAPRFFLFCCVDLYLDEVVLC